MRNSLYVVAALAATLVPQVIASDPTDSYSDADPAQSGYLPNHNMDPNVVASAEFGQLWKIPFNNLEQFYAKPLVYTPLAGGNQLVFLASSQNWIRTLDAKSGAPINARQVHPYFLQSEIGCTDIPNNIGITGTPVIDPATDIVYFFSKTYIPNFREVGETGVFNGVYYFHAVNINTLVDVYPPVLIDGAVADNDPNKYFIGGIVLQRPSLAKIGNYVYAGFGAHCDLYNYTGLVLGMDVTAGKVVSHFVTEAGPLVPQTNVWNQNGGGGQGGIWMSGMALSTDGSRLFWVSGNGDGHQNVGSPAAGSSGCQTLGEACVNLNIGDDGKLILADYFQPFDYQNLDGGDLDFGSGGVALLDPTVFKGTGVSRMAVTAGKNGKIYILNADNLGGYRLAAGQDNVVQTITTGDAVFGGSGSYPLEGGYIYSTPIGYATSAYKLGFDGSGKPQFSFAGASTEISAGRVGVGIPTVTSYQGQEGTGILWMADPNAGLRAWHAVPDDNGVLKTINLPQINGANKFQRPAFGDKRLYITDANGVLYCLGSPVNLPLNCTSPVQFGSVALGSEATETVTCTANIAITAVNGVTVGDPSWQVSNASLPTGPIKAGTSFSFPVTWNLENTVVTPTNVSYGQVAPGVKSTALTIFTTNGVALYATEFPVSLTGTEVSNDAFLEVSPLTLSYSGIVLITNQNISTNTLTFVIKNAGLQPLTILGYAFTTDNLDGENLDFTNVTTTGGISELGVGFASDNLPAVGTVVAAGQSISVDSTFDPVNGVGAYISNLFLWSTGGAEHTTLEGSASTAPIANFSISTSEGGWLPQDNLLMDFGDVAPGSSQSLQIRICNNGGSVLEISKSKPPNGVFHIDDPTELHESQDVSVGACAYGSVIMSTNVEEPNIPDIVYTNSWTLNCNDLNFGVHVVQITGTMKDKVVGPTNSTGSPRYEYLGCYSDTDPFGRLLPIQPYVGPLNTNDLCQTDCAAGNYIFSGTEYQTECYCGNTPPPAKYQDVDDVFCTFSCAGDSSEACGGVGGYISIYYDPTKYTPGNDSSVVETGPFTVNVSGNYNYIGCYSEGTNGRALSGLAPAAPAAGGTIETCEASCQGYTYFGMEYANECYCGNTINTGSVIQASTDSTVNGCNMQCAGNSSELCGGPNRLNMYKINGSAPVPTTTTGPTTPTPTGGPVNLASVGAYLYYGCYTDNVGGRALAALENPETGAGNTIEVCANACNGYHYMGVEYGTECYCDNAIQGGNTLAAGGSDPTQNGCDMTCAGNSSEWCGGPNRLNVYTLNPNATSTTSTATATPTPTGPITVGNFTGYGYLGCYSEGTNGRALSGLANPIAGTAVTVPACAAACSAYTYFGVEYSGECYCGNIINAGSALVLGNTPAQTQCDMTCSGNTTTYCGGPNRLNMYQKLASASSSVSTVLSSTVASSGTPTTGVSSVLSTTTASPTPTGPITVHTVKGWSYLGCYTEATNTRALSGLENPYNGVNNTVEACAIACAGFSYFGVEYGAECYCGNSFNAGSVVATGGSDPTQNGCNMVCNGNANELCGGGNRLNAYQVNGTAATSTSVTTSTAASITISTATATPTGPLTVGNFAGYAYLGCYSEATNARALSDLQNPIPATNVSVEACAAACSVYTYFGVEYSQECYCGNTINTGSALVAGTTPAITGCSMLCAANSTEYCGGPNRLNMYQKVAIQNKILSSSSGTMASTGTGTGTTSLSSMASTTASSSGSSASSNSVSSGTQTSITTTMPISTTTASTTTSTSTTTATISSTASASSPKATSTSTSLSASSTITSVSSTSTSTTTTKTTSTTSATTYSPTAGSLIGSWEYVGCANETNPRALPLASYSSSTGMTVESCQKFCTSSSNNYGLAGIEYGGECYCANALQSYSAVGQSGCNMACTGNSSEICGGSSRLSVYNLTTFVPPTTVKAVGSYVSEGCYNEASNGRLLTGPAYTNTSGMTVESCVAFCKASSPSQAYAGVEYGQECYCGSSLPNGATTASINSCNMLCTGNAEEFCGAASLLNVYYNQPSSVNPSGNVAAMNANNAATISANTTPPSTVTSTSVTSAATTTATTMTANASTTTAAASATASKRSTKRDRRRAKADVEAKAV